MRQGSYEILILGRNGVAIAEHELEGKQYIASKPNTEYKVKVVLHGNDQGVFPYPVVLVVLNIDDMDVGYTYALSETSFLSATFQGFRKGDLYQAFKLTAPAQQTAENSTNNNKSQHLGTIKAKFFEAVRTNIPITPDMFPDNAGSSTGSMSDDKKFWEQPSLQTARGKVLTARFAHAPFRIKRLRSIPDATLEIKYHTTDMVNFLKGLHAQQHDHSMAAPASPVHVDLSAVVDIPEPVRAEPETVDLTGGEKRIKTEPLSRAAKKTRYSAGEVVDLTV